VHNKNVSIYASIGRRLALLNDGWLVGVTCSSVLLDVTESGFCVTCTECWRFVVQGKFDGILVIIVPIGEHDVEL